jgi:ubiquinol-cytochrome c reductase cytochrome b subunit
VCEQTLKRFFSVHFILGLAIGALALIHIILLHDLGSSGTKNENVNSKTYFITIFSEEIIFSAFVFFVVVFYVIFFKPLVFMHPANFEQANPLQTPEHIVPE